MTEAKYKCEGSCKGTATEEQYNAGAKTCGAESCDKKGQPLTKVLQCEKCKAPLKEGEEHKCAEAAPAAPAEKPAEQPPQQ